MTIKSDSDSNSNDFEIKASELWSTRGILYKQTDESAKICVLQMKKNRFDNF